MTWKEEVIALLKKNIERQSNNDYSGMNEGFDAIGAKIYGAHGDSGAICQNFLDCWCDEVNHDFANYHGLNKEQWPVYAQRIIDELKNDSEIQSEDLKEKFTFKPSKGIFNSSSILVFFKRALNKILAICAYFLLAYSLFVPLLITFLLIVLLLGVFATLVPGFANSEVFWFVMVFGLLVGPVIGTLALLYYFQKDINAILKRFGLNLKRNLLILLLLPATSFVFASLRFIDVDSCDFESFLPFLLALKLGGLGFLLLFVGLIKGLRQRFWYWGLILTTIFSLEVLTLGLEGGVKRHSIKNASIAGAPIIEALARFKADKGKYPDSLGKLLPGYLDKIPHTKMCGYPEFEYAAGEDAPSKSEGYMLSTNPPDTLTEIFNRDIFFYWPSENYPENCPDKHDYEIDSIKKVNNWVHCTYYYD